VKVGNKSKMEYALSVLGEDNKVLANISIPKGTPAIVVKELKSLIELGIQQKSTDK
jgi:hypothetical protein